MDGNVQWVSHWAWPAEKVKSWSFSTRWFCKSRTVVPLLFLPICSLSWHCALIPMEDRHSLLICFTSKDSDIYFQKFLGSQRSIRGVCPNENKCARLVHGLWKATDMCHKFLRVTWCFGQRPLLVSLLCSHPLILNPSEGLTLSRAILFLLLLSHLTEHDKLVLSIVHFSNSHCLLHYHDYTTRGKNKAGWINAATCEPQSLLENYGELHSDSCHS